MTKIMFIRLAPWMGIPHPHPQDSPYAFDVAQVAGFLDPQKYEVFFLDGLIEELTVNGVIRKIIAINPSVIALTVTSSAAQFALEIFKMIKSCFPNAYLIGFGQHAHYCPQTFLNEFFQIDACVFGEPELTLLELIQETPGMAEQKRKINGIYFWNTQLETTPERPLTIDLDQWPMPRYRLFKGHDYRIVSNNFNAFRPLRAGWVLASRGCPYQCTICSPAIRRTYGSALRKHSPARVADTFQFLAAELDVNTIYFGDDAFSLDMNWAEEVCDELISRNNTIQWSISTRADKLSSKLIKKMRAAGLRAVSIGIESGSERILKEIKKEISLKQIVWALSELTKNKIDVNVTAIVGHIDEELDELKETFSLLNKSGAFFVQLHYLSPYPGTKIAKEFKDKFGISKEISHFNARPINVSKIPDSILADAVKGFYLKYYLSRGFIKKYLKYRLTYAISNPIKEGKLIIDALAYFLSSTKKINNIKIFVPRQSISVKWPEILKAICQVPFKSGCGKDVALWEQKFAELINVPNAISFISARAGTYFTLKALREINHWENPEIICPSYTFFSVPWAAKLAGWNIRFADILAKDLTLDPESLRRQVNKNTRAVIVTHLNGKPARITEIFNICKNSGIRILEDCAHAIGINNDAKPIGSCDIGCFSFGDGKNLGTFCGGMITTSDQKLADALRMMVSGFPKQTGMQTAKRILETAKLKIFTTGIFYPFFLYPLLRWFGYLSADNRKKDFIKFSNNTTEHNLGFKFSDLQAKVGLSQLRQLEKRNQIRRTNSSVLRENVSQHTLKKMLYWDGNEAHTMLHDAIVLNNGMEIIAESLKAGIDFRSDYCGNCRDFPGFEDCPGEDKIGKAFDGKIYFIPNHLGMGPVQAKQAAIALDRILQDSDYGNKK